MEGHWNAAEPNKPLVSDIVTKIRYKLSDLQVNKFSDEEVLMSINEALILMWDALASVGSTLTQKVQHYTLEGKWYELLPDDFTSMVRIETTKPIASDAPFHVYKPKSRYDPPGVPHIEGHYIFGFGDIALIYNYLPREVSLMQDFVDIPFSLVRDLVAIACNYITNNSGAALQVAASTAGRVSQKREFGPLASVKAFP